MMISFTQFILFTLLLGVSLPLIGAGELGFCVTPLRDVAQDENALARDELKAVGVLLSGDVEGLSFNGGLPFDIQQYFKTTFTQDNNRPFLFEHRVAQELSKNGERFLGLGDDSVRRVLIPNFDEQIKAGADTPTGADLISVSYGRGSTTPLFHVREVKSGPSENVNIDKAISQMTATANTLLAIKENADLAPLEVAMTDPSQMDTYFRGDKYRMGRHLLGLTFELEEKMDGQWVPKRVSIRDQQVPVILRLVEFESEIPPMVLNGQ